LDQSLIVDGDAVVTVLADIEAAILAREAKGNADPTESSAARAS
jgi:hypothetical protein